MKRLDFIEHVHTRAIERATLLRSKGAAYSGDSDAFANFKRNAEKLGLTPYQVWAVYCGKHLDAIFGAIRRNPAHPVDPSEGLQGRVDDAVNYLDLFSGMVAEQPVDHPDGTYNSLPSNVEVAERIATLFGGNGLSRNEQVKLATELLNTFYGPRHFSL